MKPLVIETLMRHSTGISSSLFKLTETEMLSARYSKGEVKQFGGLSKLSTVQFVELLNRKAMRLNGPPNSAKGRLL